MGFYSNPYLKELNPFFSDRVRYFSGTLRILLPLPGRYTKWWGLSFTYGLREIKVSNEQTYMIEKGLKYVVPYELYKQFFKILRDAISYGKYQTFPCTR